MARTGDEPVHARSPLGLRLGLTVGGAVLWGGAAALMLSAGMTGVAAVFAGIALLSVANAAFVVHRIRQGPHWQPGPSVPPYRPLPDVDEPGPRRPARPPVDERTRARRYLVLMGVCLGLLVLAWGVVRLWSVPVAVGMSMVAMVLPPVAALVANHGWDRR